MKKGKAFYLLIYLAFTGFIFINSGCSKTPAGQIIASGTVESTEINVNAETGGKINELTVTEGSTVKQGDVMARIESTVLALQVQQAEAALRAAQERARETRAGSRDQLVTQAQEAVRQMSSLQEGAEKSMDNALENLERVRALFKEGGVTSQQVSDAQTKYETARAQFEAYSAQRNSAREQLDLLQSGATQETVNIADAGAAQAQAALSIARAQLAKTVIYAPTGGYVSTVNFNKGEFINPSAPLITLTDTSDLWINVYIPEKDLPNLKLGQKAEIYIDAYPEKPFHGKITFISNKAEFTPKNLQTSEERVNMVFTVKLKITDGKDQLKPGLPADVKIITQ